MGEKENKDFYWYWFVNIPGVGAVTKRKLLQRFGHPEKMFYAQKHEYEDLLDKKKRVYFEKSRNKYSVHQGMARLKNNAARFIHWESEEYPGQFRTMYDPPYGFYLRGRMPDDTLPVLGMIGSRRATAYGIRMAEYFAGALVKMGVQIVSGLAAGIDTASHWGAVKNHGYTLGVLGGGIDTVYPRENFNLYMEMYQKGGVLSEYNIGTANHPGLFPMRNRLISGISDGIFVLEAGEKSGSFITVDQALEQGKDVFALPGRVSDCLSFGCNKLIAEGACLVQEPEDIFEILIERTNKAKAEKQKKKRTCQHIFSKELDFQSAEQKAVYNLLDEKIPKSFNEILEKSGYNFVKLQYILLEMEISQWIYQPSQNNYLRKF